MDMKKIYVLDYAETADQADAVAVMYLADEADARIAELESVLREARNHIDDYWSPEMLAKMDRALMSA